MKKGLLQRASKNWEEIKSVTLPADIKEEPLRDNFERHDAPALRSETSPTLVDFPASSSTTSSTSLSNAAAATTAISTTTVVNNNLQSSRKVQSMIAVRKDYSYKYAQQSKTPSVTNPTQHEKISNYSRLDISQKYQQHTTNIILAPSSSSSSSSLLLSGEINAKKPSSIRGSSFIKEHDYNKKKKVTTTTTTIIPKEPLKRSTKPNISILERYNYDKSNPKVNEKIDRNNLEQHEIMKPCAIITSLASLQPKVMVENLDTANILKVPTIAKQLKRAKTPPSNNKKQKKKKKKDSDEEKGYREEVDNDYEEDGDVNVILAQQVETPATTKATVVKQESGEGGSTRLKQQTLSTESKDSQNINKINNKINIIFQLNDNSKSLRKNIILHRRTPKKTTKITIKEANNNVNSNNNSKAQDSSDNEATAVPEKILCTIETQTEDSIALRKSSVAASMSMSNVFLQDDIIEHLFFEDDILICLQHSTISFFEYHRLSALLKKGETDFRFIDRIARRLHDIPVDDDNKLQRLCYNEENPLPIYVEMRAKQKELDDPEISCPIAFVYCNVYYIDQRSAKFSSVHLDTVKSVINDIFYTTVPKSCYFLMAWSERSLDMKNQHVTGIVKYKLTPNLDLAKLASIRQFPKLNYQIKQMYCGKDSQLITTGDSQVSIFNYSNGDLLISLDLMKSYGTNLTTFEFEDNFLFMVFVADAEEPSSTQKRLVVIGVNKRDGNTFKVIQSSTLKIGRYERVLSSAITSTNHLIATFTNGSALMMHLENFRDVHFKSLSNESIVVVANDYILGASNNNSNVGLAHFTEFFLV